MMRVYLAGPIHDCTDSQANGWRGQVRAAWGGMPIVCVDPMARDYRGKEAENVSGIVDGDKQDIASCDLVLAFCWRPSWGTAMEIHYAHSIGVPVHAVVTPPVSPWVAYHATVYDTLGDAVVAIARLVLHETA